MNDTRTFRAAISFAGEDRATAKRIVGALRRRKITVFYDEFYIADMIGRSMSEYLEDVYSAQADHCIMLISEHYVRKPFPAHERRSALARTLTDTGYLIPLRLDDAKVPGLPDDVCYLDLRKTTSRQAIKTIVAKIEGAVAPEPFPIIEPLEQYLDTLATEDDPSRFLNELEPLLAKLRQRWASRLDHLVSRHPAVRREDLFLRLLRREMHRAIETVLVGSDTLKLSLRPTRPTISFSKLCELIPEDLVQIMALLDVLTIEQGGQISIGAQGEILARRRTDSLDLRAGLMAYQVGRYLPYTLGVR